MYGFSPADNADMGESTTDRFIQLNRELTQMDANQREDGRMFLAYFSIWLMSLSPTLSLFASIRVHSRISNV
jgi:hypothetical protein